jgi:hypothetical protein
MNIGMLWFDNDPKTDLSGKIERAASYYRTKYGQSPTVCFVHPSMAEAGSLKAGVIDVKTNKSVLPHHFWIGINGAHSAAD